VIALTENYIRPQAAYNKLRAAELLCQTVYIYAASGFGKTELLRDYLGKRKHIYISCADKNILLDAIPNRAENTDETAVVVIDDLHMLTDSDMRKKIIGLDMRDDVWLIMISRVRCPLWLTEKCVNPSFMVITENDLRMTREMTEKYLADFNIKLDETKLNRLCSDSEGNIRIIRYTVNQVEKDGITDKTFCDYLEKSIISEWEPEMVDFLMKISITDEFTLPLAKMVTGDPDAALLLKKAAELGCLTEYGDDIYRLRPTLLKTLRKCAPKVLGDNVVRHLAYTAGIFFEMNGQDPAALEMFVKCGDNSCIKDILIRNARHNCDFRHYFEMRKYYLALDDSETEKSVMLMSGMSMLYSLMGETVKSEYWYGKLKNYHDKATGAGKREAAGRLVYLDITLPHRGSAGVFDALKKVPSRLFDNGIALPEFSVTSGMPSVINGSKDFCDKAINGREFFPEVNELLEKALGSYGKGLANAALGESIYESGGDTNEVLPILSKAQLEADADGKIEISFAATGIGVRLYLSDGCKETAENLIRSFEKRAYRENALQLLPNIKALKCRIALLAGDIDTCTHWMNTYAPNENADFCISDRFLYLTKVRCYIANGLYNEANALIKKLRDYSEKYDRKYIHMQCGILEAIAKYSMGLEWQKDFADTVKEISAYRFIRIISEEGTAVLDMVKKIPKQCLFEREVNREWYHNVIVETEKMARKYPVYLKKQLVDTPDFTETALKILSMQADGKSVKLIAHELNIDERTVKCQAADNYRKLGVSGKSDAVLAARNMGII
jgi:LuxR family maltose regulon positive regulatory protein